MDPLADGGWLPVVFAALMGLSILLYVILDGYDLGVGLLMADAPEPERDRMIASIGPFWDANETWLVLGIGLLLVAFPSAHGLILTTLYVPVAVLLLGLTLRGVAFEFRAKAGAGHKVWWDRTFVAGSAAASLSQGWMLGQYILGFQGGWGAAAFSALTAVCLASAYAFIGAAWLVMKTDGPVQARAAAWARRTLWLAGLGMVAVSAATPLVSPRIFDKWFGLPEVLLLAPIPLVTAALFVLLWWMLRTLPRPDDRWCWVPFAGAVGIFLMGFQGLAYSFYPYVVPERLTVWEAAASDESLTIILVGAAFVLPTILAYTAFAYRVFWGKARTLTYG